MEPHIYKPKFRQLARGMKGSEGPVFNSVGDRFYMVAPEVEVDGEPAGQILMVDTATDEVTIVHSPSVGEFGGIPAGCQMDTEDNLWIADMRLGLLCFDTKSGKCRQICTTDSDGRPMQGCNDCIFDNKGNLWLTAPAGPIAPAPYERSMQEPFGSLYCYSREGVMKRIDSGYRFPNGVAVQYDGPDAINLIVAETPCKTLWSLPFTRDNEENVDVSQKKVFGSCLGSHEGGPDGMDFDSEGNLLVANWGSGYLDVFGKSGGQPHSRIKLPFERVSNLHFQPKDKEVYVTEHDSHGLWCFTWLYPGAPQYCEM
ncbi:diisopropyl-fluorophosphatase-like [Watersipora subatra]|uniref:diisopropyl-fluorophosphatase-like n=1 Tax=Watersipora subatra TaxID=2589382 RepID=UPI00355AE3BE